MKYKLYCMLLISSFAIPKIEGQEEGCRPLNVIDMSVSDDFILSWQIHPNETCTISHFLVAINIQYVETVYTINETSMDLSFLATCEATRFVIRPVSSDDLEGYLNMMFIDMPLPSEANLTLHYFKLEQQKNGGVSLAWEMDEAWRHCAKHFRVLISTDSYDDAVDIYVETTSVILNYILPCEDYTFSVRAVYTIEHEGALSLIRYSTPSRQIEPPTLQNISLDTTSVTLEWQLESYTHNRCQVSSIIVDSSPYFRAVYPVRDNPERPIVATRITGLQENVLYFLNVTVINVAGPSIPFLTAVQTLARN